MKKRSRKAGHVVLEVKPSGFVKVGGKKIRTFLITSKVDAPIMELDTAQEPNRPRGRIPKSG